MYVQTSSSPGRTLQRSNILGRKGAGGETGPTGTGPASERRAWAGEPGGKAALAAQPTPLTVTSNESVLLPETRLTLGTGLGDKTPGPFWLWTVNFSSP